MKQISMKYSDIFAKWKHSTTLQLLYQLKRSPSTLDGLIAVVRAPPTRHFDNFWSHANFFPKSRLHPSIRSKCDVKSKTKRRRCCCVSNPTSTSAGIWDAVPGPYLPTLLTDMRLSWVFMARQFNLTEKIHSYLNPVTNILNWKEKRCGVQSASTLWDFPRTEPRKSLGTWLR